MSRVSRRTVLKSLGVLAGGAALTKALSPLAGYIGGLSMEELLQRHYKELTPDELDRICRRLEKETKADYGADVTIGDTKPAAGTRFGYALNLSVCIGCRKCVKACHVENNHDRPTFNSYIRVLEMQQGSLELEHGNAGYDHPVPAQGKFYLPVQCQQCANPPCVKVCPVEATWKQADGVVAVDYNWCIGCRYCQAACPYHARRFNWQEARIPADEMNCEQGYLSNRVRPQGVMEKCTFCLHRTREGRLPACLEACPAGARVFGDLLDSHSDIRWVLNNKKAFVLKEDVGTVPSFYYFFDE